MIFVVFSCNYYIVEMFLRRDFEQKTKSLEDMPDRVLIFRSPGRPHSGPRPGRPWGPAVLGERPAQQALEPCVHASAVSVMGRAADSRS